MKKLLAGTLALFISTSALADTNDQDKQNKAFNKQEAIEYCANSERIVRSIVRKQQDGVPLFELMEKYKDVPSIESILATVYRMPVRASRVGKEKVVTEFVNEFSLDCLKGVMDDFGDEPINIDADADEDVL